MSNNQSSSRFTERRNLLKATAGAAAVGALAVAQGRDAAASDKGYKPKGNVNHSITQWCFADHWDMDQMCKIAKPFWLQKHRACRSRRLAEN